MTGHGAAEALEGADPITALHDEFLLPGGILYLVRLAVTSPAIPVGGGC